jgi:phosphate:Na+ symporter
METNSLHLDIIRDLKAINSHLISATAYPVLEKQGELLQSRFAPVEPVVAGPGQ